MMDLYCGADPMQIFLVTSVNQLKRKTANGNNLHRRLTKCPRSVCGFFICSYIRPFVYKTALSLLQDRADKLLGITPRCNQHTLRLERGKNFQLSNVLFDLGRKQVKSAHRIFHASLQDIKSNFVCFDIFSTYTLITQRELINEHSPMCISPSRLHIPTCYSIFIECFAGHEF